MLRTAAERLYLIEELPEAQDLLEWLQRLTAGASDPPRATLVSCYTATQPSGDPSDVPLHGVAHKPSGGKSLPSPIQSSPSPRPSARTPDPVPFTHAAFAAYDRHPALAAARRRCPVSDLGAGAQSLSSVPRRRGGWRRWTPSPATPFAPVGLTSEWWTGSPSSSTAVFPPRHWGRPAAPPPIPEGVHVVPTPRPLARHHRRVILSPGTHVATQNIAAVWLAAVGHCCARYWYRFTLFALLWWRWLVHLVSGPSPRPVPPPPHQRHSRPHRNATAG
eukprot:TRINITY_DN1932_c0_g1_i1.p1 TRINITY_DN1932_c0_g1~~TRINITY_DN1932_c0_g1_i1.p1  ORF type:complete len:276 (-),score=17.06 TRINITY_DN1932_c0_g1_i1:215-1042(-)